LFEILVSQINGIMRTASDTYGVNPTWFLAIYLVCVPIFYYSLARTVRALAKKQGGDAMLWSGIFLCANVAPFIYVIFFGRNIPWWVFGILALIIGQSIYSLIQRSRESPKEVMQ
jgi:hypothetical protein